MTNETALFLLRLVGSILLLAFMGALFWVLWRDVRGAAAQAEATRRSYGKLMLVERPAAEAELEQVKSYPLLPLTSIGRSPTNTIRIEDTFASGEHALIALRGGAWWLEDRRSRNGTLLNGMQVNQPVIITDGDLIGVGSHQFRIELE
ncbi:MAG: FHA domain-containing protein [bacterium]|nr:FHA domain-containing protein [bacterium]